ncbi:MAG: hypothetical protein LC802_13140 [Acidobacteria bacterium]|nr:hypothetical protein [Acidobacteriota bacterium]
MFRLLFGDPSDEGSEIVIGEVLNLIFLTLAWLMLWPLGRTALLIRLAWGYAVLWLVILITYALINRIQRFFRVDADSHFDAYVLSNLSHSIFLLAGWSAFAALAVRDSVGVAPAWVAVILYVVGFLSSYVAFIVLSSFYIGSIYKLLNLTVALVSFVVFAVWPAAGRVLYGWFFGLF